MKEELSATICIYKKLTKKKTNLRIFLKFHLRFIKFHQNFQVFKRINRKKQLLYLNALIMTSKYNIIYYSYTFITIVSYSLPVQETFITAS